MLVFDTDTSKFMCNTLVPWCRVCATFLYAKKKKKKMLIIMKEMHNNHTRQNSYLIIWDKNVNKDKLRYAFFPNLLVIYCLIFFNFSAGFIANVVWSWNMLNVWRGVYRSWDVRLVYTFLIVVKRFLRMFFTCVTTTNVFGLRHPLTKLHSHLNSSEVLICNECNTISSEVAFKNFVNILKISILIIGRH